MKTLLILVGSLLTVIGLAGMFFLETRAYKAIVMIRRRERDECCCARRDGQIVETHLACPQHGAHRADSRLARKARRGKP